MARTLGLPLLLLLKRETNNTSCLASIFLDFDFGDSLKFLFVSSLFDLLSFNARGTLLGS